MLLLALLAGSASAATLNWKANTTGDWFDAVNWDEAVAPTNGDIVFITNSAAWVILSNSTYTLADLTLGRVGNTTNTLIFTNWGTYLSATNVSILSNGSMTCAGAFTNNTMSNRVYVICSNITLAAGGSMTVNAKGYSGGAIGNNGHGPGAGKYGTTTFRGSGAGYGGIGGRTTDFGYGGLPYGTVSAPDAPGSGGAGSSAYAGGAGGGAIRIQAGGVVTNNGTISANGGTGSSGGGSGNGGGGSGGRIAVIYTNVAANTAVRFSVTGGSDSSADTAEFGTLYFSDTALLTETLSSFLTGWIVISNFSSWSVNNLTVSNVNVAMGNATFSLTVTNNLVIGTGQNSSASIILGRDRAATTTVNVGNALTINGGKLGLGGSTWEEFTYYSGPAKEAPTDVIIGGNVTMTNGGSLWVYSGMTNTARSDNGALMVITGNVSLATSTWIYVYSNPTNGGSALFRMNDLVVLTNAGFNANSTYNSSTLMLITRGYYGNNGPGVGGSSPNYGSGAGHGGQGGAGSGPAAGGPTYGYSNAPVSPGSGGWRSSYEAGQGGGAVRIVAVNVTLNGTITADATQGGLVSGTTWGGGGSGGSVYLRCRSFGGGGLLSADGGNGAPGSGGNYPGGGGGGRIAVWSMYWSFAGTTTVTGGLAAGYSSGSTNGQPGTLFWGQLPLPGTIFTGL